MGSYWQAGTSVAATRTYEWACPRCTYRGFALVSAHARGAGQSHGYSQSAYKAELAAYETASKNAEAQLKTQAALLSCPKCGARKLRGRALLAVSLALAAAGLLFPIANALVLHLGDELFRPLLGTIAAVFGLYILFRVVRDVRASKHSTEWTEQAEERPEQSELSGSSVS